jgi:hypothetical protein
MKKMWSDLQNKGEREILGECLSQKKKEAVAGL